MKPSNENDRKSASGIRRGMSCGRPIPVVNQNRNIAFKIDLDFTALNKAMGEAAATVKQFAMTQEERDRIANDRRWATDPLELMDKLEEIFKTIIRFLVVLSS